jgi:hypothetical protein
MRLIIDQNCGILHLFLLEETRIKRKIGEVKDEWMLSVFGKACLFFGFSGLGGFWRPYDYDGAETRFGRVLKVQPSTSQACTHGNL